MEPMPDPDQTRSSPLRGRPRPPAGPRNAADAGSPGRCANSRGDIGGDIESVFTRDELLTNVAIYWFSGCITSSTRLYYEAMHSGEAARLGTQYCRVRPRAKSRRSPPASPRQRGLVEEQQCIIALLAAHQPQPDELWKPLLLPQDALLATRPQDVWQPFKSASEGPRVGRTGAYRRGNPPRGDLPRAAQLGGRLLQHPAVDLVPARRPLCRVRDAGRAHSRHADVLCPAPLKAQGRACSATRR